MRYLQDELKKLYAQLEVYKRKKMLANNPHLQKKRNSKKGLGRSLMKRITEIPETMHIHRQCSREDGSEQGSNRSTLRRNHFESGQHGKIMLLHVKSGHSDINSVTEPLKCNELYELMGEFSF